MLQTLRRKRSEQGFTLIELLIVIIILAILAAIVIFAVGSTTKNAAVASCKSTVKTVETAVEAYKAQVGTFPSNITQLTGTTVVTGVTVGPWLRTVPPGDKYFHISIADLTTTGKVYVSTSANSHGTADTNTTNPCTAA